MQLCYIDESGTSDIPGTTTHFILAGLAVPIWHWTDCEREITEIKKKYNLGGAEIHTAWIARRYVDQETIQGFDGLDYKKRAAAVNKKRLARIYAKRKNQQPTKSDEKNNKKTEDYIHLTYKDRMALLGDLAECIQNWGFARLFAECIDKTHFEPSMKNQTVDEQALEQLVSRFETFLHFISGRRKEEKQFGLLIHDNNHTVAHKHTELMLSFHNNGTLWTKIHNIIETPLFVDSKLTSMVQIADFCSYAIRRYLENDEKWLFEKIFVRADRNQGRTVGVRHYTNNDCACLICTNHTY